MNTQQSTVADAVAATIAGAIPATTGFASYKELERISFVRSHDPKTPITDGMRLAAIRYRDTTGKAAKQAKQVVIPQVSVADAIRAAMPAKYLEVFTGTLEDAQDIMIRQMIDADMSVISWDDLTADTCIEFLTAARVSERLTKEKIEAWVPVALGNTLDARSKEISDAAKHSPEQVTKQIAGTRNAYVTAFAKLAAAVPNIKQNEATALELMLNRSEVQDDIAKALRKKLDAILRPVILKNLDL